MRSQKQDVRHMTLGMDGAWDAFRKLQWEVAHYKMVADEKVPAYEGAHLEARFPMYCAINAAATSWSLIEWVWFEVELDPIFRSRFLELAGAEASDGLPQLKAALRRSQPAIDACHQISHATKHAQLTDVTPGFSTKVSYDVWQRYGWHYWSAHAALQFQGRGELEPIEELFNFVCRWWHDVLRELQVPDRAQVVPGTGLAR